jgi:hypothetical protein
MEEVRMNVSWIEEIFNNTDATLCMWSTDAEHNGTFNDFDTGEQLGDNDWGHVFEIEPGARIKTHWCGIPWYGDGTRYRVIARGAGKVKFGLRLHQAETDDGDGIYFIDFKTNDKIGYIAFPFAADRQFALVISGDADNLSFDLQNRQTKTDKQEVVKLLLKISSDIAEDAREIFKKAAGQAVTGKLTEYKVFLANYESD